MEKQVLVKKTLKCVCAAALMVAILAAQHDSLVRVKAEDKLVQTSPSVSAIDDLHYLSENSKKEFKEELSKVEKAQPEKLKEIVSKAQRANQQAKTLAEMKIPEKIPMKPLKGPLYGGYFRTWHDKTSDPAEKDKVNSMGELPKEVDLAFVFHDWTKDYSLFWQELATKHVPTLNKQGTRVIRTIPWRFLAGGDHSGIAEDAQKYPNTPEGNKALAKAIVDEYVYKYNLDGLDVDVERDSIPKVNGQESNANIQRSIAVFEEIGKLIGPKGADRSRLFIMDSTYMADKNPLIERGAPYIDLLLVQVYGAQGEKGGFDNANHKAVDTMEERWESYSKYIRPEQYMVGFSFYEEKANSGNLWYDVNVEDDTNPNIGSEIKGTRAERYAKWQPKTGGVKGGIFSYGIDRDGVAHPKKNGPKTPDLDKIVKSDYKVSKALKKVMENDKSYELIDETDFPDKALREAVIAQVGSRRGDLERFNGTLRLDNPAIQSLEGLNKLKKLAKLELIGLSQITKLDSLVLPANAKPTKDTLVSGLETYKNDDRKEEAKAIPQVALTISGLTGLKELNLAGFERETLAGIDAASLTSLEKVDLSKNKLDLAAGTENRQILDTMLATVTKHGGVSEKTFVFDHQKPTGLYPDTYGTKSLQLPVANDTIDLQAKLLFGTVTNQGTLINSEADYKAYQEQEIAGHRFVDSSYDYKAFAVTYKDYKIKVTDSTLGVTDHKDLSTSKEETYKVEFFSPTNSTKPVHEAKVVVGEEKTMMVNLAEGATIIGGSADQTNAKKVFDGLLNNDTTTLSTSNKASIIFELKESGLVKHWRFFNDSAKKKEDYIKEAKLEAFVGHLEDSSKVKDSLEKSTEWVTVSDYSGEAQEFSQPLNNVGAKYWRITIDNKKSQYGYVSLPELQLIGYQLPAAYPVMATLAAAEELSQQKDKFSQKQLKELEVKVAALKAALDNKMFNADTINASFADVKAYVDKLLADAAGKKTPGKATKEAQLVTTDAKEKAESEKSKAN
ncbi:endo-beta-N-acetylglucosaminidase F2 precursor [Streptococcus equi subsp. zooepidemicus MGCS10565]|uniref:mannosyl-glycoprotein endo-beta-N-acetylglucosaminidase n=1 Tax=Streptococcus equi subsp. zooepidemicus (strain MGCS10565) TaxID=552526 RepID=B4U173_STREM|nr:endo-beta-N-acetylglucosaminidase family protein [Streptococcus equi]ACG61740.1 endo-beta-N-acetylglucosaminidase F2 precursor [Streptococcus equi subsp. zooepidemicus MGCS10565]MDI6035056.1 endo-beta-N-acetylglucosaminidase family protein [Streptococcus equi subsp. zooepidemicus]QZA21384.1 endo-beta-N-acetylglucosaminidase [Streptococcus equi subsp. zooepidemicus]SQF53459.1 endoglycosidase EndoS [Streptococcus equi subsp. zooepidemicus]HEL0096217.1 endo-beta-N-acetylglucosaminidase [Strept